MPLRDDILNPISEDAPSGANLRYAPVMTQLKDLRAEELRLEAEEQVSGGDRQGGRKTSGWDKFLKLSNDALATKTKDLQIAVWMIEALIRCEGFPGLKAGLDFIKAFQEQFWDTFYPEIEDGDLEMRSSLLEWLGGPYLDRVIKAQIIVKSPPLTFHDYTESRAVGYEEEAQSSDEKMKIRSERIAAGWISPEDFDKAVKNGGLTWFQDLVNLLEECLTSLEALDEYCRDRYADYSPGFGKLRDTISEIHRRINIFLNEKKEAAGIIDSPPEETREQEASEESYHEESGGSEQEQEEERTPVRRKVKRKAVTGIEPADKEDADDRLAAIAQWMRAQDASNAAPYLLLRGYRWGELRAGGDSLDSSLLEAPPTEVRTEIKRLANEGAWDQVLETGENAMATPAGRGWLDLQRYTVRAAEECGHYNVATAIKAELRALLTDLPSLLEAVLADDTPTANRETQEWITENILPPKQEEPAPAPVAYYPPPSMEEDEPSHSRNGDSESADAPPDAFQLAQEAARSGDRAQAIEILTRELAQERSGRGRFNRRMQLAQICLSIGQEMIARPILEELSAEIEKRHLEEWESGDVVAHPLALLYRCLDSEEDKDKRRKLYALICKLDPVQALGVTR